MKIKAVLYIFFSTIYVFINIWIKDIVLIVYVNVFLINALMADFCRRYRGSFCILFISLIGYRVNISNSVATRVLRPFSQLFLYEILYITFKTNCVLASSRLKLFKTFEHRLLLETSLKKICD